MNIATPHPATEIASSSTASSSVSSVVPIAKQQYVKSLPFTGRMGFRKALNERVDAFLQAQGLKARDLPAMYAKSVVVLLWWAISYALWMYSGLAGWHWATSIT